MRFSLNAQTATYRIWLGTNSMRLPDFYIGLEFVAGAGFRWRCTDVGARTISAIRLTGRDPVWHAGPPYISEEVVFDELDIERCDLTHEDAIRASARRLEASAHPGFSAKTLSIMLEASCADPAHRYPNQRVLRLDRRRTDGEILHPYAGRKMGEGWTILLCLPFLDSFDAMPECEFIALPIASDKDIEERAGRCGKP